ncbi:penicillin-binding transpeptidase domain-containing protein [Microbacterium stercoris]|uniref:Beta-lactamase n=1 Tax=Microbacterium stercoris TaxID=2820289 RepID=A0A939QGM1_9MICO|nr:penicillin-binding transpeptidase domain-containing protein [Microbacterium stercoris]MBO3662274.1 penicillin-binding protein [Microbacterium stercoris]
MRITPRLGAGVAVLALLLPLAGCTDPGEELTAKLADSLAASLSDHTLSDVELTNPKATEVFDEQIAPLADYPVKVTADDVEREGGKATVELHWSWDIEGHTWEYSTTAALLEDEESEWAVDWATDTLIPELGPNERIEIAREFGPRADVVDTAGTAIVTSRPVGRYGLDKANTPPDQVGTSAEAIANALGLDPAAFRAQAEAAGAQAFVEGLVVREGQEAQYVKPEFASIPGALRVADEVTLAPTRTFAREILGVVGDATAEIVEKSEGAIRPGDRVGLSGLLKTYDDQLRGTPTTRIHAVEGETRRELAAWKGEAGKPVAITLDLAMQTEAEQILSSLSGENAPASALVAIRPSTGEVLAAANGPGNGGMNAATAGEYAPGSTFKLVTSLALLRSGLSLDDVLACPTTLDVDGYTFHNFDDYPASGIGAVSFRTALANSCNTAMIGARDRIDPADITSAAATLGLTKAPDLGFPLVLGGVPKPEGETERAADLIGQGRVTASPLGMATVAASIAAGRTVVPHLIDGKVAEPDPKAPLTDAEAASLQELMRAVVTDGSATFLASIPGAPVGAKTGTAEYGDANADGAYAKHSWMIGTHGDLAVAVFVETGVSGAQTAGPLLQAFFEKW